MSCQTPVRTRNSSSRVESNPLVWLTALINPLKLAIPFIGACLLPACSTEADPEENSTTAASGSGLEPSPLDAGSEPMSASATADASPSVAPTVAPGPAVDASSPTLPAYERVACDVVAAVQFCGGGTCHY